MEEKDDPFASLTKRCKPTSSQEDILKTCPFTRQFEVFPDDAVSPSSEPFLGIPVDPTGIVMVSPPEADEFQTPPEDSLPAASSDDQRTPPPAAGRAVDLGKDSDGMPGFSGTEVVGDVMTEVVDVEVEELGEGNVFGVLPLRETEADNGVVALSGGDQRTPLPAAEKAVDLGKDSDDMPGFSGTEVVDSVMTEVVDVEVEELGEGNVFVGLPLRETEADNGVVALGEGDGVVKNGNGDLGTSHVDPQVEELGEDNVFGGMPLREAEVDNHVSGGDGVVKSKIGNLCTKNIDELDKFKFVGSSGVVKQKLADGVSGRRKLPPSLRKGASVAGEEPWQGNSVAKDKIFKGLLDGLKMVAGQLDGGGFEEEEEEVDFLEIAKRRDVTFPMPRWWPREDYDD